MATNYRAYARRVAARYGLDPVLFERQIQQESGFQTKVTSGAGATGIAQFMPGTARSLGIDPNNPTEALRGAAKLMAGYVKKYGSYENALRAYNAGPGAIQASRGYAETNNYVKTILGGRKGQTRLRPGRDTGGAEPGTQTVDTGPGAAPMGVPQGAEGLLPLLQAQMEQQRQPPVSSGVPAPKFSAAAVLPQGLMAPPSSSGPPQRPPSVADALGAIASQGADIGTTPPEEQGFTGIQTPDQPGSAGGATGGGRRPPGQLKELFWQGPGGLNVKDGKRVQQGFVSGHDEHVHVATGPKQIREIAALAKRYGLHVGEHPEHGGVAPVHTQGSYHYRRQAVDVSGGTAKQKARFARAVARRYGV